jgi:AcrR family transcriptional regulator
LLDAAAAALERHGAMALTVDRVLEAAPMGRNTFYEHFTDVKALVTALVSHAEAEIFSAIDARCAGARTPLEGLRALALAWLEETAARPSLALALLVYGPAALPPARPSVALQSPPAGAGISGLSKRLRALLEQARRDALTSVRPDPARVEAVAASIARLATGGLDVGDEQRRALAELSVDLAVRAFR